MDEENQYIIIECDRPVDLDEAEENILVNSREFGKFRLMTLGIPMQAFVVETTEEPLITNAEGVSLVRIAYKRPELMEDDQDDENGELE